MHVVTRSHRAVGDTVEDTVGDTVETQWETQWETKPDPFCDKISQSSGRQIL